MWKNEWFPRQTVRPRSNGKAPVLLCLLVAGLTAMVVYRWGREKWWSGRPVPTYTATANVVSDKAATGGESHIPITFTDAKPQRAKEMAEAMAERCIADRQREWRRRMEEPLQAARHSVKQVRAERDASVARLEAFEKMLRADSTERWAAINDRKLKPSSITNPRWLELEQREMELLRRRDQLLVDRTPLHPAVQEVSDKIVEIQAQMAKIPREIPYSPTAAEIDASLNPAAEKIPEENRRKLAELTSAVADARAAFDRARQAEQDAEARMQAVPQYTVEHTRVLKNPPAIDYGWRRLMWTTLVAGVMMAFGAGSLSVGAGIEPPVASAAEVRAELGNPVVGTIPAEEYTAEPEEIDRQWRARRAAIAAGLLLMAACPAVAIWGVMGI